MGPKSAPKPDEAKPKTPGAVPSKWHKPIPIDFGPASGCFDHDPKLFNLRDSSAEARAYPGRSTGTLVFLGRVCRPCHLVNPPVRCGLRPAHSPTQPELTCPVTSRGMCQTTARLLYAEVHNNASAVIVLPMPPLENDSAGPPPVHPGRGEGEVRGIRGKTGKPGYILGAHWLKVQPADESWGVRAHQLWPRGRWARQLLQTSLKAPSVRCLGAVCT